MATRTLSAAGGTWSVGATWDEGIAPVLGDAVVCRGDGTSGQLTISGAAACTSINFTNYSNTLTINATLSVSGAVTLAAAMTITTSSGSPLLSCLVTATLTSNGKTWGQPIQFAGTSQTYTLADNWTVSNFTSAGATQVTINGNTLNISGNLTATTAIVAGTTNLVMTGTGTWSGAGSLRMNLTFNSAGTITWSGTVTYGLGSLVYTAGTMVTTGSTLTINTNIVSVTLNLGGMNINNISFANNTTHTLSSDINALGNVAISATSSSATINGFTVYVGGNLTNNTTTSATLGTTAFIMNGSGTLNFPNYSTGAMRNNITINTAGTIVIGNVSYNTGSFIHTASGSISVTAGSTLNISLNGTTTIDSNGIQWVNAVFNQTTTGTYTFNSLFVATGTVTTTSQGSMVFNGTAGFTIANFVIQTTGTATFTLTQGNTYIVTTSLTNFYSAVGSKVTFASSSATLQVIFTLSVGATCAVGGTNATRIDSSGGRPIRDFGSNTFTTTNNWYNFTDLAERISASVS